MIMYDCEVVFLQNWSCDENSSNAAPWRHSTQLSEHSVASAACI